MSHAFFLMIRDLKRYNPQDNLPYGIKMFVGLPGTGKTISMVEYLYRMKLKYPKIKIFTNFGFALQDGHLIDIDTFQYINSPHGIIFAVDEVQLSFQARQFNRFPSELIYVLTQNRKFKKQFVCTAQLFEHVDKVFRDLTNEVIDCTSYRGRYFRQKTYVANEYKKHYDIDAKKSPKIISKYSFVATDFIYNLYDTMKIVDAFQIEQKRDKQSIYKTLPAKREDIGQPI